MSFCRSDIQTGSSFSLNETSRAASRSRSKPGVEKAQTHRWSAFSHQHPKARRLERTLDAALKLGELGDKVVWDGRIGLSRQDGLLLVLEDERRGGGEEGRRCEHRGKGSSGTHAVAARRGRWWDGCECGGWIGGGG
jgi:hypothetical protein